MAAHKSVFTILDHSGETSVHRLYNGAITAVSIAGFLTDFGAYRTALEGIIRGVVKKESWIGDDTLLTNTPPADPDAQREIKMLVRYTGDTTAKLYSLEIACPDLTALTISGKADDVDIADGGVMAAWVTAFEQIARSPDDDTETVTVVSANIVGRNL